MDEKDSYAGLKEEKDEKKVNKEEEIINEKWIEIEGAIRMGSAHK